MKRFVLFVGVLISVVWMLDASPVDSSPQAPEENEWPKQTKCTDLKVLPYKPHNLPGPATFKLYIGRIMTQYTAIPDSDAPDNTCSPLSYLKDNCQEMEFFVDIKKEGTKTIKLAAYNKATNNVMCYTESAELQDQYYHIFKAKIDKMVLLDGSGNPKEIPSIPKTIANLQDSMIATLKYGEDFSYAIYSTCCKSAVWIAYSEKVIKENLMGNFKEEIDKELVAQGFDPAQFIDVQTSIPISLDNCFVASSV